MSRNVLLEQPNRLFFLFYFDKIGIFFKTGRFVKMLINVDTTTFVTPFIKKIPKNTMV